MTDIKEIGDLIHDKIVESLSFEVPILILTIEKLKNIIENNPFLKDLSIDKEFLYYTFLANKPEEINTEKLKVRKLKMDNILLLMISFICIILLVTEKQN